MFELADNGDDDDDALSKHPSRQVSSEDGDVTLIALEKKNEAGVLLGNLLIFTKRKKSQDRT